MRYAVAAHSAANAVVLTSVPASVVAAVIAALPRRRARTAALAYRAGFAAGLAWSVIRGLGTRPRDGFRGITCQEAQPIPDVRARLRVRAQQCACRPGTLAGSPAATRSAARGQGRPR